MEIQKFIQLRENLYHLTDEENLKSIFTDNILKSTSSLAILAKLNNLDSFLKTRRSGHVKINNGLFKSVLRDQDPLFEKIVTKNIDPGMTFGDFVLLLNSRVFFWATEKDLLTHYKRYSNQGEYPVILRFKTSDLFEANKQQPEFCRLNSGAPRCSAYYKEGAPRRGASTFLVADKYSGTPSSVREVTFQNHCKLPSEIFLARKAGRRFIRL